MSTAKVIEDIPRRFTRRGGDLVYEGANNTLVVLGTDRADPEQPADTMKGLGSVESVGGGRGTGTIHLTVGRKQADPSFQTDDAFIYVSQKTMADANLRCEAIIGASNMRPAIIAKSTDVRIAFGGPEQKGNFKLFLNEADDRFVYVDGQKCEVHHGNSKVTLQDGLTTIDVNGTRIQIDDEENIKVGRLAQALQELIQVITVSGSLISQTGNLGAPVPMNPALTSGLNAWAEAWISGDKFIKMK